MRIKKFIAPTMKEATEKMKKDLGPNAIILGTRPVREGGLLSFLAKEMVEVTGGVDDHPPGRHEVVPSVHRRVGVAKGSSTGQRQSPPSSDALSDLQRVAERFSQQREFPVAPQSRTGLKEESEVRALRAEIDDLKGALRDVAEYLKYSRMPSLPHYLKEAYVQLVEHGVDERVAADVVQNIYGKLTEEQLENRAVTEQHVLAGLAALLVSDPAARQRSPDRGRGGRHGTRVVALVGPTGVGKTTTIAKLAAINKLMHNLSVALISADTYRIGALEQLRTFAAIADIPMEVAYKPSEVQAALKKFRGADTIFVDTVGRSQRSARDLAELKKYVETARPDETHLVVSASTAPPVIGEIVERFRPLRPNRLLISKVDEVASLGPILGVAHRSGLPLSYLTTGQVVPDDIVKADAARIAAMVYHGTVAHA